MRHQSKKRYRPFDANFLVNLFSPSVSGGPVEGDFTNIKFPTALEPDPSDHESLSFQLKLSIDESTTDAAVDLFFGEEFEIEQDEGESVLALLESVGSRSGEFTETGSGCIALEEAGVFPRLQGTHVRFTEKVERLKRLDGRHHRRGYIASKQAISEGLRLMRQLYWQYQLVPDAVNATPEENVLLEFEEGSCYDAVEIFDGGRLIHTSVRPNEGIHSREIEFEDLSGVSKLSLELAHVHAHSRLHGSWHTGTVASEW